MPDTTGYATPAQLTGSLQPFVSGPVGGSPMFDAAVQAFRANTLPTIQQQFQLQGLGGSPALGQAAGVALGANLVPLIQNDMANRLQAIQMMQQGQQFGTGLGETQRQFNTTQLGQLDGQPTLPMLGFRETQRQFDTGLGETQRQFNTTQLGQLSGQPTLPALGMASDIANQNRQQALQAAALAGNLILGSAQPLFQAGQLGQSRQQLALESFGGAGQAQREVALQQSDAAQQDFLRRQALAEASTLGLFSGGGLPSTVGQTSTTTTRPSGGGGK